MPKPIRRSDRENRDFLRRFFASKKKRREIQDQQTDIPVGGINLLPEAEIVGERTQYEEPDLAASVLRGGALAAREAFGMVPIVGEALDVAEFNKIRKTGKDFYEDEADPTMYAAITAGGLLVPNLIERPARALGRAAQRFFKFGSDKLSNSETLKATNKLGRGLANKTKFVSEIDWSKWNPETPKYPELIKEYNEIEKRTKRAGTWMRNADGTDFVGSPEQFIQQQSYYYRKAFPDGGTRTYRGVGPGEYKTGNTPRWDDSGYDPAKAIPSNRPVFVSEDFEQALGYAGGESNPTEFLRFQNSRDPRGGTFNLQAPSGMTDLASDQSGRGFSDLGSTPGTGPFKARGIRNVSSKEELNKFYSDYNDWARKNKKASITSAEARKQFKDAPKFNSRKQEQAWIKANIQQASTDDVAEFMASTEGKKYSSFTARDIDDNAMGDVRIHQNIPGNYLKSNIGNVGFFDLSDPDVFKALVPIVGTSAAIKLAKSQGVENPGQEMSKGGSIAMKKRPTGMSTIRK